MGCIRSLIGFVSLAAFAVLVDSCGNGGSGSDSGVAPRFLVAAHGDAQFENDVVYCPDELSFSVFLEAGGTGWVSLEHDVFGSEVVEVTWAKQNGSYVVTAPRVRVRALFDEDPYYYVDVGWERLSFEAHDEDGDGTAETGEASATLICDWEEVLFPYTELYDATFDLRAEVDPAVVAFEEAAGLEPIYTFADAMNVTSSKPLLTETLAANVQLLANGAPIPATVTPRDETGPFANGFRVDPAAPVPFDADLTIDLGGVADAFGRAVEFDRVAHHTVADPGPLTVNPSFEGDGGWIGLHKVGVDGYSEDCNYATSSVWLETSSGSRGLFPDIPDDDSCNDYPYGCVIPWTKSMVSLEDLRGQRVVLRASPARFSECRPDVFDDLHLDDVRIE